MSVRVESTGGGLLLPVKVQAGARRDAVTGVHDGQLKVSVSTAPERGLANKAVTRLLAAALQLKPAQLTLIRGKTSGRKQFLITGCDKRELQEALRVILPADGPD